MVSPYDPEQLSLAGSLGMTSHSDWPRPGADGLCLRARGRRTGLGQGSGMVRPTNDPTNKEASMYHIYQDFRGGSLPCQCGKMACNVTSYVEPGERAYYQGYCSPGDRWGDYHSAPHEVSLEEAKSADNLIVHLG